MEKRNSQLEHGQPMEQTRGLFHMCDWCGSLAITTPVSLLAMLKRIARASELGSCQFVSFMRL